MLRPGDGPHFAAFAVSGSRKKAIKYLLVSEESKCQYLTVTEFLILHHLEIVLDTMLSCKLNSRYNIFSRSFSECMKRK